MNAAHWHLALNHIPVLGTFFGIGLLAYAVWKKSEDVKRAGLGIFVLIAALAVPAYLTGEPAEDSVKAMPGASKSIIDQHEEVAQIALTGLVIVGVAALAGLIVFRRAKLIPAWFALAALLLACIAGGLMLWTANLGGQIRHPEIRSGASSAAPALGLASVLPLVRPAEVLQKIHKN